MKINDLFKTKIPFSVALLAIVAAAACTEQIYLQAMKENNQANNAAVIISLMSGSRERNSWSSNIKEKVALTGANIPIMTGAKRLTFDNGYAVRYRVSAPAQTVAAFYRQALASQGWKTAAKASANAKLEKLTIAYAENPLSKKTDITYAYIPANGAKVLGVKIAEGDTSAPAPVDQPPAPQPSQPPTDGGQFQPQPNQPAPDGQFQPQGPMQPINQPPMNQMEFSRPPMQPFPGDQQNGQYNDQNNQQNQPWADMCSNNTALACVDGAGKFVASPKVGSDGKPVCPADSTAQCGKFQQNNQQGPRGQGGRGQGDQYNNQNQGQRGQDGQFNQGQDGQMGRQGPSEEDQKKMDEQRFKDMKRGLSQFSNGAKMMKRSIARIKIAISKCGVGMPEELNNALAQTDSLVEKINAAQTADELDQIISDVQDVGSVMQDWGPRMGDLTRLCQIFKQADRDAKQLDRNVKRIETQVKANKKVDLSGLLDEYKTAVAAQKDVLAQAKELAKTDPDSALSKIEDDFYGNMDNLSNLQMQIDTIVNMTKGLRDISRELNTFASQIKALNKKKVDTTSMQELLNTLKTQVAEIKNLISGKADVEELVSKVEEAFDTRQELQDALQEYDMIKTMPQVSTGTNYNIKMNLPDAFIKSENNNDNGGADNNSSAQ